MRKQLGIVALECLLDLGVTFVYAVMAGLLIVGVVATDEGPASLLRTSLSAAILPAAAALLIVFEIALRIAREWRAPHRRVASS